MTEKRIEGVVIKALTKIPDERGCIYHMLRSDDDIFEQFGEIYFSEIYPDAIKGWHMHKTMTLNYTVIKGMIKLVMHDDRVNSPTRGTTMELFLGKENYSLVKIPPMVWNGFKGMGVESAIVANCSTHPHDPEEIIRMNPFAEEISYDWSLKHG